MATSAIRLRGFLGKIPAINARYLPDLNAQTALNTQTWYGSLRGIPGLKPMFTSRLASPPAKTIWRYNGDQWFEFTEDTDVTDSPIPNDAYGRAYYTSTSKGPRVTSLAIAFTNPSKYPSADYAVGVPTPPKAPTAVKSGTGSITERRYYIYTAVNIWGEEGAPSSPSSAVTLSSSAKCVVTLTSVAAGDYAPIAKYRVYRTNSFGTAYQFVGETTTTSLTDNRTVGADALASLDWTPPPTSLRGLIMLPNGVLAAFTGNQVRLSEPGIAHAWPASYSYQTDAKIVAIAPIEGGLIVLTVADPYLIVGSQPESMIPTRVYDSFACVSKRGVVKFGTTVVYPASHGFVAASSQGAELITDQIFAPEDWSEIRPSTMTSFNWRNRYVGLYTDTSGVQQALAFDPAAAKEGIVNITVPTIGGVFEDRGNADVYVSNGGDISKWAAGSTQAFVWKSKPYELPYPRPMRLIQVQADAYPVIASVYRDGKLQDRVRVADRTPHRVRNSALGLWYEVEVTAVTEVFDVVLASTIQDAQTT
jgi:hypothetical protein